MADPITVIATAGAISNIVDVLGKTLSILHKVRIQWKAADLTFMSLMSQLTALRAALIKIQEWIDANLDEAHHQLVMDLDVSLACCKTLIGIIDGQLSDITKKPDETLDLATKFKFVFNGRSMDELLTMIERQTSSINLLLTACNWCSKTLSEQQSLLEKSSTRKLFGQTENDSASLIVHRDSLSFSSPFSDNLSKLSRIFPFDRELFTSKVYEQVFRGSLKATLRRHRTDSMLVEARERSEAIDRHLKRDEETSRREEKVLLIGTTACATQVVLQKMRAFHHLHHGEATPYSLPALPSKAADQLTRGIEEHTFDHKSFRVHIVELGEQASQRQKFINQFDGTITAAIIVVSLTSYKDATSQQLDPSQNSMKQSLQLFDSLFNSRVFKRKPVILLLTDYTNFKKGLSKTPLNRDFPDYTGGNDAPTAVKYILRQFNRLNRNNLAIYPHLLEPDDMKMAGLIFSVVAEASIHTNVARWLTEAL
ncbi:uncharacterized protein KY384_009197 [Bacidia gigantensis]|uniref:uncharacterized protein n=1 Tax=Bacidia gigantensis TaxID=2732470 RepID=UPI001D040D34|nr:uncharacterized protein KY384_009197 [Bacidia gigantensis]KAG8525553.1 hypothetical protein KY384_009197 [Bacidia gigantensis]